MKKNIILVSTLLFSLFNAQGVQNYKNFGNHFFPQSPNSTPFAVTGKYPVNMYKGVPIIGIPLFANGKNHFKISLDYNVKSVKPSTIPTWVGLGWNLNVGGSITRIVNGGVDEVYQGMYTPYNRFSYLDNYSTLDNANWNSQEAMQNYHSANLQYISGDVTNVVPDPDEFIINVGGITGSFYLNEKGKWIGRTREGRTFKVEYAYKSDYLLKEKTIVGGQYGGTRTENLKRILYGFTITMDDGVKYIFGLDDTAIEFSSPSPSPDSFNSQVIASSWQIKEIQYPNGKTIKFNYERDERAIFMVNKSSNASWYTQGSNNGNIGNSGSGGNYNTYTSNRLNNVFLKKVEGEDFIINFNRSETNQKEYEELEVPTGQWIPPYTHHFKSYTRHKHWYKLDGITITDKAGKAIKNIVFNYNNDSNDRLLLNNLSINSIEKYSFQYNAQKLPNYTSDKIDGWGFYNGNNFESDYFSMYTMTPDQQKDIYQNTYPTYKAPNLNLSKAGVLEQITYPTGGKTNFEYELNDYSKYGDKDINENALKIIPTTSNQIAGGLRIKRISSCNENNNCINKTYSYLNDGGTSSSGILPYKPIYVLEGNDSSVNLNFWEFNSNSFQSIKDEDNSVGYSKVTEIDDHGGKTESYFTNLDQMDYADKRGVYFGWYVNALFKQLPYLSFSLMRGKPLKEVVYSSTKKISETSYLYTQQTDYLKAYTFISKQFGQAGSWGPLTDIGGVSYGALLDAHQVNFNTSFLAQKKTTVDNVETIEQNFYDYTYNNPTSIWKTEGNGDVHVTTYKYASDIHNPAMLGAYMVGVPISQEEKKNNKIVSKTETVYPISLPTAQTGNLLLPISELYFDPQNNAASTEITYDLYDSKGNLQQYTTKDGVPVSLVWGYNQTQPIAKIEGAMYTQVSGLIAGIISASDADAVQGTEASENALIIALDAFRTLPALVTTQITTYTYNPQIGVTSITPTSGVRENYIYDSANRLEKVIDVNGKVLKEYKYNYKN
ncbi:hypothetical protein [Chryseobacterium potabilaquae]|uniref:YD repeat-containing protein n=1 Tax=Chryseobacterium potabilaquae TaxID=2675057 RepID=A0A6N4XAT3_9FLAO|nr:hypothetical protein [Chryseobacterium potabilaquae]CAA7196830.1 hypothetical protein CHRY9293_02897 [Chryseobacterium potabilaquae]